MQQRLRRLVPWTLGGVVVALVMIGVIYLAKAMMTNPDTGKKTVQQISLIQPPPPPKLEEPPPPPEVKQEEIKLDEPPPAPEPEAEAPPPGEELGLDAEGGAGGDGFGLRGNKGGRGLLGGDGNAFGWYGRIVKHDVSEALSRDERLKRKSYSVIIKLWLKPDGRVERVELAASSGATEIDTALRLALQALHRVKEAPPSDLPQPIKLRITART